MFRSAVLASVILGVFLIGGFIGIRAVTADQGGIPHMPDEVILKFKTNASDFEKNQVRQGLGGNKIKGWGRLKAELRRLGDDLTVEEAIAMYSNHPKVEYIEPNYIITADEVPDDPRFNELWGMQNTGQTGGTAGADISATNAWDVFTGSSDVLIGVIDTGVDYNHPDLAANIWTNPGEIAGNGVDDDLNGFIDDIHGWDFVNNDNDPMDDNGHGSHCSGTIGAVGNDGIGVAGVNWTVKIMALKFLSSGGTGSTAGAISCIEYATMMGVNLTSNSWGGGGFSQALEDAIADAGAAGQLFVAAAGNSGLDTDASPHYPSSYDLPNIISVAATDHDDTLAHTAFNSNYGLVSVDLAAPGEYILSTTPGNTYSVYSGTSMATPHVAGAVGLVFGRFPAIGHLDAKNLILNFADPVAALDGFVATGARLNAFFPIADPDSTAPGMITDLAAGTVGSNWVDLDWTAVGDDDYTGTASRYIVKYSTSLIDAGNFDAAMTADNPPDPGAAGSPETMRVAGLDFSTDYYFAAKAVDEFGNAGPISNVPMATTLGAPDIDIVPTSLSATLLTGATDNQALTLSNLGEGTLDFVIPTPDLITMPPIQAEFVDIGKGEIDIRTGNPVIEGTGGPDGFGYRWVDSDEAFGPTFNWVDISGTGTAAITSGDDTNSGPYPIGFNFSFYGVEYSEFRVCSNGWMSFTSTSTAYANQPLPTAGAPLNLLSPFWTDLVVGAPGNVYYESDGTRLIVQWDAVDHYGSGGPYTFQAQINADGTILYQYLSMGTPDNDATVGIQDASGTDGLTVAFNTAYIHDNLAVRYQAVPQWLAVTPTEGTVWAPGSTPLDVAFDATGLIGGEYEGNINVLSNDPDEGVYTVPVTLTVIGAPDIDVAPASFDFGQVFLGATPTTTFQVNNPGTDVLTVTSIAFNDAVYTVDMTSFTVPPRGSQPVVVTFSPLVATSYPATMTVTSDDPDSPTVLVPLAGEGVVPPDFSVDPTSLFSALFTGETDMQALTLTNDGGADLEYSVAVDLGNNVTVYNDYPDLPKGEVDVNAGILGSGGPDGYGYSWIDSDDPGGPAYDWVDISGVGTPAFSGNSDDGNMGPFPIGFDFSFYGNVFPTFRVSANGWLSFTSSSTDWTNAPLPGTGAPENLLALYHDDMYVDADIPSNVYYHNDGSRLIVQWNNIRLRSQSDTSPPFYTFQAILYPNGTVVYQYESVGTSNTGATVGIQNDARDDGLTVSYNTAYAYDGLAVRFSTSPDWMTASPLAGVIPPGGFDVIDVNFNAADLFGGLYEGSIDIATNDPLAPLVQVPTALQVTGAPNIGVDPTGVDFGQVFVGYPESQEINLFNSGTDDLIVTAITSDNPDFIPDLSEITLPLTLAPLQSTVFRANFSPSAPGPQTAVFTIMSNDPDEGALTMDMAGEGLDAPIAGVDPDNLSADLLTGETETQSVLLTNTGGSNLEYNIAAQLTADAVVVYDMPDLAKGEADPNPGILGTGGPDVFGYSWTDSDEPGGPAFDWVDISGTGTPAFLTSGDDSNRGPFPIGFNFSFYGNTFTEFRVCSNGWVSFTSTSTDLSNSALPGTGSPENLLAAFHDDLNVSLSAGAQVFYEYDGSRLIIQYDAVPRFSSGGPYTFEIILYPNGTIMYQYLTMEGTRLDEATIGIQNATRDDGLTVVYNDDYVHDNMAIRFSTTPEWLTANPTSGVIPPGGGQLIDVTFDATGLFGGDYNGAIQILNNDPANGLLEVASSLHVTGVPRIGFSAESVDFGNVFIGYPEMMTLTVTNIGTDLLSVSSVVAGLADYSVTPDMFDLEPLASVDLTVTLDPQAEGDRNTMLTFMSNDPDSPQTVDLTGVGLVPPIAGLTPDPVVGAAMPGGSKTKPLTLCNTGGSDLTFEVAVAENTVQVHGYLEVPKGVDEEGAVIPEDPRQGFLGSGGPDSFGYRWVDSDDPGGPAYDWVEISGVGTPVPFSSYSDDGNVGPVPIGFAFPFYGDSFSELNACTNGWMSFTSTLTSYSNQPLPNGGAPENLLAPWWDDMVYDESDGNSAYYYNDGSRFIIQYDVRRIGAFTPPFYKFQVILYPNGDIVYQYHTLGTTTTSATIGIQNDTKDDGLTVAYNESYVHENLAIKFSAAPEWLTVSPTAGVVPAGECVDLMVMMNAASLEAGDYFGEVSISTNDPANPTVASDVIFHVGTVDAADFDVDPNTVNLGANGAWITSYVELPPPYDPNNIDPTTVYLNGTVLADSRFYEIGDFNDNGIPDAMFKFDRRAVMDILPEGDAVPITVTGEIIDTIYFVGMDHVRVIHPSMMAPNGGELFLVGTYAEIRWANPDGWDVDFATLTYSPDDGETWELIAGNVTGESYLWRVPDQASEAARIRVYIHDAVGVMGSDSSDEPFAISGQVVGIENTRPSVYALTQNSPNPFQASTRIAFDLPEDTKVKLTVYDVSGRVLRVIETGQLPAGRHMADWDGRDSGGRDVASGIYFYRLEAANFTATRRMIMVK